MRTAKLLIIVWRELQKKGCSWIFFARLSLKKNMSSCSTPANKPTMKDIRLPGPETRIVVYAGNVFKLKYKLRFVYSLAIAQLLFLCSCSAQLMGKISCRISVEKYKRISK